MIYNTLALGPNERAIFSINRPNHPIRNELYAVMLRSVPLPPKPGELHRTRPLAVLCARYLPEGWRWTYLEPTTKQRIGRELLGSQAIIDRWYFMEVDS